MAGTESSGEVFWTRRWDSVDGEVSRLERNVVAGLEVAMKIAVGRLHLQLVVRGSKKLPTMLEADGVVTKQGPLEAVSRRVDGQLE